MRISPKAELLLIFVETVVSPDFKADILVLVDSSSDVDQLSYNMEKNFVKSIARSMNLAPEISRIAIVSYGDTPRMAINFDSYSTTGSFEAAVDRVRSVGGERRIDLALDEAVKRIRQIDPTGKKIVVLLTAGRQTPAHNAKGLKEASKPLHDLGVYTYVVPIGNGADARELSFIVESSKDMFSVPAFENLVPKSKQIALQIVKRSGGFPVQLLQQHFISLL